MSDEWSRVVTPILSAVLDNLTLSPSLETQNKLIKYVDLQSVKAKPTDYERKTELLYNYLWTRGPGSLQQFCRALEDAGNSHLANLLRDQIGKPETEPPLSLVPRSSRRSYSDNESEQGSDDLGLSSALSPRSSVSSELHRCYVYIHMSSKYLEMWNAKEELTKNAVASTLEIPLEKIKFVRLPKEEQQQFEIFVEIDFDSKVDLYFLDATPELIKQHKRMLIRFLARRYETSREEISVEVIDGGSCFVKLLLPGNAVMQLLIDSVEDLDALSFLELGTGPVWVGIGSLPPFSPSILNVPRSFISRMQLLKAKTAALLQRRPSVKRRIDSCVSLLKGAEISSGVSASCEKCQTQLTARKNEFPLTMDGLSDLNSSFSEIAECLKSLEERRKQFIETKKVMSEINSACLRKLRNVVQSVRSIGQIKREEKTTKEKDDEKRENSDGNWPNRAVKTGRRLKESFRERIIIPEIRVVTPYIQSRESVRSEIIQWIADNCRLSSSLSEKVQRVLADLHAYKDVVSNVLTDLKDDADKFAKFQSRLQEKQPELHVRINFDEETSDSVGYRGDIENLLVEGLCSEVLEWTANELLKSPLSDMVTKALEDFQSLKDNCQSVVFNALGELEDDAAFRCRLQEEQPELYDEFFGSLNTPESEEGFAGIPQTEDDKSLAQFFDLMIGDKKEVQLDDHLLIVESRSYTVEVLLDCYDRCEGKGLARELLSFMVDLLKRQRSLAALTDVEAISEGREKLEDFFELPHKEMFIALLEITPPSWHPRLVSLAVRIGCCAPFIYRRILPNGNVAMRLLLDGCRKVLDVESNPLVLSCGTTSTVKRGKTDLIGELFGLGASSQSRARGLSLHSSSPCHNLSVDLLFNASLASGASVVLADAHGFSSKSFGFTTVLGMLMSVAATTVIHVSKNDFTELGEANDDMKNYCDCFIKNNDRFGKATGSSLILLWRDHEDKDEKRFEAVTAWLESKKQDNVSLKLAKIANLSSLRQIRRQNSLKKLNNFLVETMTSHYKNILPTLCQTEEMVRRLDAVEKRNPLFRGSQKDTCLPLYTDHRKTLIKLESDVRRSLDANAPNVGRSLFPVLTLKAEHAQLEEKLLYIAATGDVNNEEVSVQLSDLEKLMKDKEECMASKGTSSFVKDFASLVLKGDLEAIAVVQRTLEKWKMFECSPPLNKQRLLRDRLDERIAELRLAGEEENSDDDVKAIRDELAKIKETIDAFNVSIDDVWAELICLAGIEQDCHRTVQRLEKECHLSRERLAQTYRDWIMQGNPMQLLRGSPLYMASEFISSVLHLFQEDSDRRVFVISVIGMQSSAKSTLLNYLFGCEFETRAGRCTRGLYASYKRTNELDLLILDSEGLMGIEGGGRDFDNKLTLMVMACSHAVIINHKGDLARHLQELLEVAVFAMNRMEFIKVRPDVLFVLRDQLDRGSLGAESLQGQLIKMQTNICKMAKKLKFDVNRYLNLHAGSLTLLPVAFACEQRNGKDVILPSSLFSNECAVLRKKILDLYGKKLKPLSVKEFSSLPQWSVHARSVWTTIRQFGVNLLYFKNMQQIEERVEAESVFADVVATHIEAPRGYIDECGKQLQAYVKKSVAIASDLKAARATFVTNLEAREKVFEEKVSELKAESDAFTTELEARKKIIERKAQSSLVSALKGEQHVCDQYLSRLTSRIHEITRRYEQAWKRQERAVKEEEIEALLVQRMDRAMKEQSMTGGMSRREFDAEFSQAWQHVDEMKGDSCGNSRNDVCREVLSAISDHRLKNINEFVYKFLMPIHGLPLHQSLATSQTADYFKGFLCIKTAQSGNPLDRGDEDHRKRKAAAWLKEKVCAFFNEFRAEKREDFRLELVRGVLEKDIARTIDLIQRLDEQLEENFGMTTEMPRFVNIMFNCLVFETVSMFSQSQTEEIEVDDRREMMRQRGLTMLSRNREDMQSAKEMVRDVLGSLIDFCKTKVIDIVTNVESNIRKILPNWSAAVSAAFKESFIEGNWRSVLAFCENASAFIRDLVDETFRFLKEEARIQVLAVAQRNITNEVAFLTDTVLEWGQANKDRSLETSHLIEFGSQRRQRSLEETVDILSYVPSYLHVRDPGLFSVSFQNHIDERISRAPITHTFEDLFEKELLAVKEKFWEDLEGCSEQCPLCSAPCDHQDKAHLQQGIRHSCQIHFLPAFRGSRNPTTKEPIFLFCSTVKEQNMLVETSDAGSTSTRTSTRAARFLNTRNWDIIPVYTSHHLTLRRAWVKCRKPILQMKHMVDSTPKEWARLFGGGNDELKADDSK